MRLEAGWVPVGLSSSIEPGTSAGAVVDGQEIVVWRDSSGIVHVWEDRCPHRGMRMSFGFVRGDHIACLYHGWQYDAAGQCRYIPAHPALDVPSTIKVPTYLAREDYGIIWATASSEAVLPDAVGAAEFAPVRSLYVDCPISDVLAASRSGGNETSAMPTPDCWRLDGDRLLMAFQQVSPDKTAIHGVILGPLSPQASGRQAHHARLMEKHAVRSRANGGDGLMPEITLYGYELDENSYRARLLLSMLGLDWQTVAIDMFPGQEHGKPAMLALNPLGTLPVVKDGDLVVYGMAPDSSLSCQGA